MSAFDTAKQSSQNGSEVRLKARSVSRGVAIGKVLCLHGRKRQFYKINLEESQIERELRRFRASIRLARRQLGKISGEKTAMGAEARTDILGAHLLILDDGSLHSKIEEAIRVKKVNAEWAVKIVTDDYIATYKNIPDENLRQRYIDIEDVAERILTALGGGAQSNIKLGRDTVIVANEVRPSTLIELAKSGPKAVITEHGGWTSHTSILAREINLPAVTGIKRVFRRVRTGDTVIVDGYNGQVIIHPSPSTLEKYELAAAHFRQINFDQLIPHHEPVKTLDGRRITIRANLDLPSGYKQAKRFGCEGIGLYRSEFLFNQYKGFPTETEQIEAYRQIARMAGEDGVRIRTFDLSIDQLTGENEDKEKNPALGLRAIRMSLTHKKQFRTQLRALLQASFENKIDIVLPMISDVSEIIETKKIIEAEKALLRKKRADFGNPRLSAMIETPSAVFIAEDIAREVDFLSLGTNDLVQYLLAVDRDNESVADWFRTLHPAVIRAIREVVRAADVCGRPLIVCGEMAGSPFYAPILIGLGVTEMSMNVNSVSQVRKIICGVAYEETLEMIKSIVPCRTAEEIDQIVYKHSQEKWGHLFPRDFFLQRKF
jgi:phosphoenolpyruvate-protein phosphotransferase (PTS system enzyme I)